MIKGLNLCDNMGELPADQLEVATSANSVRLMLILRFRRAKESSMAEARDREMAIWHQAQLNEAKALEEMKNRQLHSHGGSLFCAFGGLFGKVIG